jgi:hypothetical protein
MGSMSAKQEAFAAKVLERVREVILKEGHASMPECRSLATSSFRLLRKLSAGRQSSGGETMAGKGKPKPKPRPKPRPTGY